MSNCDSTWNSVLLTRRPLGESLWSWRCTKRAIFSDSHSVWLNRNTTKAQHPLCYPPLSKDSSSQVRRSLRHSFTCFISVGLQEPPSTFIQKTCNSHLKKGYKMKFQAPCWHESLSFATLSAGPFAVKQKHWLCTAWYSISLANAVAHWHFWEHSNEPQTNALKKTDHFAFTPRSD